MLAFARVSQMEVNQPPVQPCWAQPRWAQPHWAQPRWAQPRWAPSMPWMSPGSSVTGSSTNSCLGVEHCPVCLSFPFLLQTSVESALLSKTHV